MHTDPQALGWAEAEEIVTAGLASLWDGSKTARQITQDAVPQINRLLQERPPGSQTGGGGAPGRPPCDVPFL